MNISGNTNELYDMIIKFHDAVFNGEKMLNISISRLPGYNILRLKDFVELVEEIKGDFEDVNVTISVQ